MLGNGTFRFAKRVELHTLPMLTELVFGDASVDFCTAFSLIDLTKLCKLELYGSCLNGCIDLKVESGSGERERRVDLFKLKNIAHKKTQENDRILKSLNNFISNSNIDPEIISFFQQYVC